MKNIVIINSLTGLLLYLVNVIVTFLFSPFLIRTIGNSNYGIWEIIVSVIGYMGLLDLGIGPAVVRFVSVACAKQDDHELGEIIFSSLSFYTIVGILGGIFFSFVSFFPEFFISSNSDLYTNWKKLLLIFSANAVIQFPMTVFTATLMGGQRHYLLNFTRIILVITKAVLAYKLLLNSEFDPLLILVSIELGSNCFQLLIFSVSVTLHNNVPTFKFSLISVATVKSLLAHGVKNLLLMVTARLQGQTSPLIIGSIIGPDSIVYFIIPRRLIDYARGLSLAIGFPLTPYFATFVGKEDSDGLRLRWLQSSLVLNIIIFGISIIIIFLGVPFLNLWLGEIYANKGSTLLYFMTAGVVIDSMAVNCNNVLSSANLHGKPALVSFYVALATVPAAIAGTAVYGLLGITVVGTIGTILSSSYVLLTTCIITKTKLLEYFVFCVFPVLRSSFISAVSLIILIFIFGTDSYFKLLLVSTISFAAYSFSILADIVGTKNLNAFFKRLVFK